MLKNFDFLVNTEINQHYVILTPQNDVILSSFFRRYLSESDLLQKLDREKKNDDTTDGSDRDKGNSLPSGIKLKKSDVRFFFSFQQF